MGNEEHTAEFDALARWGWRFVYACVVVAVACYVIGWVTQ